MKSALTMRDSCVRLTNDHDIDAVAFFADELGWIAFAISDEKLRGLVFGHATAQTASRALCRSLGCSERFWQSGRCESGRHESHTVVRLVDELQRFARGEPVDFRGITVDETRLTLFGRRVTAACRRIPHGQTRSYGQLAAICGSPGAARAVGQVMARNRFPLVVPCHRVLGSGGALGGFSAPQGLAMKRRLLELEMLRS